MDSSNLRDLCEAYGSIYEPGIKISEEQVWEEVENWVNSLIEEGYDLSEYSWEDMYEAYIEDINEAPMTAFQAAGGKAKLNQLNKGLSPRSSLRATARTIERQGQENLFKAGGGNAAIRQGPTKTQNLRGGGSRQVSTLTRQDIINRGTVASAPKPTATPTATKPTATPTATKPTATPTTSGASRPATPGAGAKVAPTAPTKSATPTGPATGMLGKTSFERRTPTSAELKAAQAARAGGASPEKALQAAKSAGTAVKAYRTPAATTGTLGAATAAASKPAAFGSSSSSPTPPASSSTNKATGSKKPGSIMSSYSWGNKTTLNDIRNAYQSVYEAKKVDQDEDGDNDFADVRIARLIASGVSKEEAIRRVKDKAYNEEFELDEATRMRKELGKEGETAVRKELAARSKGFKRSGSVDKTIAAAERGADNPYVSRGRNESESEYKTRKEKKSQTLQRLASSRRKSVRGEGGLRGYAAKVKGDDKDLQSARGSARSAGTLTPAEKKQFGEDFQIYEIVSSYLLENNFAETIESANEIIENMSPTWVGEILEQYNN